MNRVLCVGFRHSCNGGLTRESWCCAGHWLGRLDMHEHRSDEYQNRYIIIVLL